MKKYGNSFARSIKNKLIIILMLLVGGCQYFSKPVDKKPVAKIYDTYLYFEDIAPDIYKGKSTEDSLKSLRNYIEEWAYKTLMIKEANRNVDTAKINHLAQQYKNDLLLDTYRELLLQKYIDTLVPQDTLELYYRKFQSYFKADEALVKPMFLVVDKQNNKIRNLKKWFFSDKPEFSDSLIKNSPQFVKFNLVAEKWYKIPDFKKEFPVFSKMHEKYILKKSKKFVLTDSLSLYLVLVKDIVKKGEQKPINFVKDDLKQLILSKRKQAALSELENNIKQEAINKKNFIIFKKQ